MILPGKSDMSFLLEPTSAADAHIHLRPGWASREIDLGDYSIADTYNPPQPWTRDEVAAAAAWWSDLLAGREPIGERHVWFGGGVAFGRARPWEVADFAIDVIVLDDPDAARPPIIYHGHGSNEVDDPSMSLSYVTIDATSKHVNRAVRWWKGLLDSMPAL